MCINRQTLQLHTRKIMLIKVYECYILKFLQSNKTFIKHIRCTIAFRFAIPIHRIHPIFMFKTKPTEITSTTVLRLSLVC